MVNMAAFEFFLFVFTHTRYANNCGCNEHQNVPSWGNPVTRDPNVFDGINHYIGLLHHTHIYAFKNVLCSTLGR